MKAIILKTGLVYIDNRISGYYKNANGKYSAYLKNADVKIQCFAFNKKILKECISECIQEGKSFLNAAF